MVEKSTARRRCRGADSRRISAPLPRAGLPGQGSARRGTGWASEGARVGQESVVAGEKSHEAKPLRRQWARWGAVGREFP
jgi:hypothetical protein